MASWVGTAAISVRNLGNDGKSVRGSVHREVRGFSGINWIHAWLNRSIICTKDKRRV